MRGTSNAGRRGKQRLHRRRTHTASESRRACTGEVAQLVAREIPAIQREAISRLRVRVPSLSDFFCLRARVLHCTLRSAWTGSTAVSRGCADTVCTMVEVLPAVTPPATRACVHRLRSCQQGHVPRMEQMGRTGRPLPVMAVGGFAGTGTSLRVAWLSVAGHG